jgi:hypothetical protein
VTKRYYPVYWAPDLDPSWEINPGVLRTVDFCFPAKTGGLRSMAAYDLANDVTGPSVLATATYGTPLIGRATANGTFVGTTKRLVLLTPGAGVSWTDKSKGAANYTTATDWQFATRGSRTFAASIVNPLQVSTSGGTFADCAGSPPKASFVVAQSNFLLLADTDDGTHTTDQVWTSAIGNDADFAPSLATECSTYLLRDTDGPITAFEALRNIVVAYKADSIYVGEYTGVSPYFWRWRCVSHNVGCSASHGVARVGDTHYFWHDSDLWQFDGVNLKQIDVKVSNWVRNNYTQLALATLKATTDAVEGLIVWYGDASYSLGLCYNVFTNRIGFVSNMSTGTLRSTVYSSVVVGPPSYLSYFPRLQSLSSTAYRNIMLIGVGATNMEAGMVRHATGTATADTGDVGTEGIMTTARSIAPRLTPFYDSVGATASGVSGMGTGQRFYKANSGGVWGNNQVDTLTTSSAATEPYPRWEGVRTAHWHRFRMPWTSDDLVGVTIDADEAPGT